MNESILKLLRDRYLLEGESSWEDIAKRVSDINPESYEDILKMDFIPSTPTLMNANTKGKNLGTLSSCFPMNIEDSIEGIFDAVKEAAIVTKFGGGIGYDFSDLRSSFENIKTINRNSSGPLAFIEVFNGVLDGVRQGGRRRGAGMALLDIRHPNIVHFIKAKHNLDKYNRLNFSIKVDDEFYKQLIEAPNTVHMVRHKDNTLHELVHYDDPAIPMITVGELWQMIVESAHAVAEPGIFNSSIAERRCAVTNVNKKVICNPCSEFTNIPYTSCSLGSINLSHLVENKNFNWKKFEEIIIRSTDFIDNTIDVNAFPLANIAKITKKTRPIGLGIMGLAHMFYKKGIAYDSDRAIKLTEEICRYMTLKSMQRSVERAQKYGVYEAFDYNLFVEANQGLFEYPTCRDIITEHLLKDIKKYGIRNSSFTSIAPTGSISTIAQTSGGIEPVFALTYTRKIEQQNKEYDLMYITDPIFEKYLDDTFDAATKKKILENVSENNGSCQRCAFIPDDMKRIFVVTGDLSVDAHLNVLEAAANKISLSVSKTINLPKDATVADVSNAYIKAHKKGIIGVTVYRDGSREGVLVHKNGNGIIERNAPKRSKELPCEIHRFTIASSLNRDDEGNKLSEKWISFVGLHKGKPYEIFVGKINDVNLPKQITDGKIVRVKQGQYAFMYDDEVLISDIAKTFDNRENDAFARLVSTALRHGVPLNFIVTQLSKSQGTIVDFSKALSRALKKYITDGELAGSCERCGAKLVFVEGCMKCMNPECGNSKCG